MEFVKKRELSGSNGSVLIFFTLLVLLIAFIMGIMFYVRWCCNVKRKRHRRHSRSSARIDRESNSEVLAIDSFIDRLTESSTPLPSVGRINRSNIQVGTRINV